MFHVKRTGCGAQLGWVPRVGFGEVAMVASPRGRIAGGPVEFRAGSREVARRPRGTVLVSRRATGTWLHWGLGGLAEWLGAGDDGGRRRGDAFGGGAVEFRAGTPSEGGALPGDGSRLAGDRGWIAVRPGRRKVFGAGQDDGRPRGDAHDGGGGAGGLVRWGLSAVLKGTWGDVSRET